MSQPEQWKEIAGTDGLYEVSTLGRFRSKDRYDKLGRRWVGKELVNARMSARYVRIRMQHLGKLIDRAVHHIVLETFVGPRPMGCHGCHNDGDRTNNTLANLRWDTASANQRDKILHGTIARGERNGASILTEAQVREIKTALSRGEGPTSLSRRFGVSRVGIQRIKKGIVWRWVLPAVSWAELRGKQHELGDAA